MVSFVVQLWSLSVIAWKVIENNETGLLIEMKDVKSLKNGIEKFIIDKKFYSYIKNNVRNKTIKKYNQNFVWSELKNEFKKVTWYPYKFYQLKLLISL